MEMKASGLRSDIGMGGKLAYARLLDLLQAARALRLGRQDSAGVSSRADRRRHRHPRRSAQHSVWISLAFVTVSVVAMKLPAEWRMRPARSFGLIGFGVGRWWRPRRHQRVAPRPWWRTLALMRRKRGGWGPLRRWPRAGCSRSGGTPSRTRPRPRPPVCRTWRPSPRASPRRPPTGSNRIEEIISASRPFRSSSSA